MNHSQEWWKDPRGLLAAITLSAIVLGLFWSRERILWELTERITDIKGHSDVAMDHITINKNAISAISDRITANERRLEINAQRILRMEGIIDRMFPQPNNNIPVTSKEVGTIERE
jgi:hypothetical protein